VVQAKTLFVITVATARLIFPNMFSTPGTSSNFQVPTARSLTMELSCSAPAGETAKASVKTPEELRAGEKVDLKIDPAGPPKPEQDATLDSNRKVTIMSYWGGGEAVPDGQPKTLEPGAKPESTSSAVESPYKSYAYWPGDDAKSITEDASAIGTYSLTTNFCGRASVTLGPDQEFMAPINITMADKYDMTKPIKIAWKPVKNAVGYILYAYGGNANTTINWTSSAKPNPDPAMQYSALTTDQLDKYVRDGIVLPATATSCTIPAGIFKDADSVMLAMTAIGKDKVQSKDDVETQVVIRSTANMVLHTSPYRYPMNTGEKNKDRK